MNDKPVPMKIFGVPIEDYHRIEAAVMEAWEMYGDDDGPTCERIRKNGLWSDHIAIQAGIAVWKMLKAEEK